MEADEAVEDGDVMKALEAAIIIAGTPNNTKKAAEALAVEAGEATRNTRKAMEAMTVEGREAAEAM